MAVSGLITNGLLYKIIVTLFVGVAAKWCYDRRQELRVSSPQVRRQLTRTMRRNKKPLRNFMAAFHPIASSSIDGLGT